MRTKVKRTGHPLLEDLVFLSFIVSLLVMAYFVRPFPVFAAWFGFLISAYSVIANDSIQTIGTFLSSNKQYRWWLLWLYISFIFFLTLFYSWFFFDGDVTHQRLQAKGFEQAPTYFYYLQIAAPIVLLVLTKYKIPVSTSFLVLGSFVGSSEALVQIIFKSFAGYGVAFSVGLGLFLLVSRLSRRLFVGEPSTSWRVTQWLVSGWLWSIWLQQDLANIAVFLPRSLSVLEFSLFSGLIIVELGVLLYLRGGRIQEIVTRKSDVTDPRSATLIDACYASVLWYFRNVNLIPMSTTWIFLGLLAGRELGMWARGTSKLRIRPLFKMVVSDVSKAFLGLAISIIIALSVNPRVEVEEIQTEISSEVSEIIPDDLTSSED